MTPLITPELVAAYEAALTREFGAVIMPKDRAEMRLVAGLLEAAGILDGEAFLANFATTLGVFVYIPDTFSLFSRLVVVPHECMHVRSFLKNPVRMAWLYATEPEARASEEARAYHTSLEVFAWLTNSIPDLDGFTRSLKNSYGLGHGDFQLAADMLESAAASVAAGAVVTPAGRFAVAWLEKHAPELKGRALP